MIEVILSIILGLVAAIIGAALIGIICAIGYIAFATFVAIIDALVDINR